MATPKPRSSSRLAVAVRIASAGWRAPGFAPAGAAARRAVRAAFASADMAARGAVSVCLSDDAHMQELNRAWRGRNRATNVLAFPPPHEVRRSTGLWGDIILAQETVLREAEAERRAPQQHLSHLVIHGTLHLLGYDHDTDAAARRMQRLERAALAHCSPHCPPQCPPQWMARP